MLLELKKAKYAFKICKLQKKKMLGTHAKNWIQFFDMIKIVFKISTNKILIDVINMYQN